MTIKKGEATPRFPGEGEWKVLDGDVAVKAKQQEIREDLARLLTKQPLKSPTESEYRRADMILLRL